MGDGQCLIGNQLAVAKDFEYGVHGSESCDAVMSGIA